MPKFRDLFRSIIVWVACCAVMALSAPSVMIRAQSLALDNDFAAGVSDAAGDGEVSVVQPDGKILVGGYFDFVGGSPQGGITRLNSDGSRDTTFNPGGVGTEEVGGVLAIALLSDGKILMGGSFFSYNGRPAIGLARLNSDGTFDASFNSGGSGIYGSGNYPYVNSIAVQQDGKILVAGGYILGYNGVQNIGIFRLNSDGTLDASFTSRFTVFNGNTFIERIVLQPDGKILLGLYGTYTYGDVSVKGIIRLNADSTLDSQFNTMTGTNANSGVLDIALLSDGKILISGYFASFNGTARDEVARLNTDGTLDVSFNPVISGPNEGILFIAVQPNGQILIGGNLGYSSGYTVNLARLNADGTQDSAFMCLTDSYPGNVALQPDGKIIMTGDFGQIAPGNIRIGIARFEAAGSLDPSFTTSLTTYGNVKTIVRQSDGKIMVAGEFTTANGIPANGIARFNEDGTYDSTFNAGLGPLRGFWTNAINKIVVQPDGKILVGGLFEKFNGSDKANLLRLNPDGSVDPTFTQPGLKTFPYGIQDVVLMPDGKILVCADTLSLSTNLRIPLARLNPDGSLDSSFATNGLGLLFNARMYRILVQPDGKIVLAGMYNSTTSGGLHSLVRLNTNGTRDTTFTAAYLYPVTDAFLLDNGKIVYSASSFIGRVNSDGTTDSSFSLVSGYSGVVNTIAQQSNGKILIGGTFTSNNGELHDRLHRLNSNGGPETGFDSGLFTVNRNFYNTQIPFYGGVNTLLFDPNGRAYVGGAFSAYDGAPRSNLLRFIPKGQPTQTATPTTTPTASPTITSTSTATATATNTPIGGPTPPSLGNYPSMSVALSDNVIIAPSSPPSNTTGISVSTSTGFQGRLTADSATGVVRVTNANRANLSPGAYAVTVKAFGPGGSATATFQLTVTSGIVCYGNPSFSITSQLAVGFSPYSVSIGDLNNDGNQDLVTTNRTSNDVSIRLGNGAGGFTSPPTPEFPVGIDPRGISISDFNGDGFQDLAISNFSSNSVSIRLGNGIGGFTAAPSSEVAVGFGPWTVAVGDFNGDGVPDLAVGNFNSNNVSIRLGNGDGSFTAATVPEIEVGANPKIAVGDFNNDGITDLVTSNQGSNNVSIRLGNGDGGFHSPGTPEISVGAGPKAITIGDFNRDGMQDLAVPNSSSNNVSIRLGNGSAGFTSPSVPEIAVGFSPLSITLGDFNNDGNDDLAVGNNSGANISIRLGNGNGSFVFSVPDVNTQSSPVSLAVGDFNGDGIQDMASASGFVLIIPGSCNPFTIGGTVTYGNAIGTPTPRYVSNVTIAVSGQATPTTRTAGPGATAGQYALNLFGPGPYTIAPSKTGGINGSITSFDAAKIAQHVAGINILTGNQLVVADVSGNGTLSSFDAGQVARFVAGILGFGSTGSWKFNPVNKMYPSVTASLAGENYSALLMGEVSGSWTNTGARPGKSGGSKNAVAVKLPNLMVASGKEIIVPFSVLGVAKKGVISYEFDLHYDASVIRPLVDMVDQVGTVSSGFSYVTNTEQLGRLRVVMYGPMPIDGDGVLLNLRFVTVGKPGSVSPLTFGRFMLNEGIPLTSINGQVELSTSTPN